MNVIKKSSTNPNLPTNSSIGYVTIIFAAMRITATWSRTKQRIIRKKHNLLKLEKIFRPQKSTTKLITTFFRFSSVTDHIFFLEQNTNCLQERQALDHMTIRYRCSLVYRTSNSRKRPCLKNRTYMNYGIAIIIISNVKTPYKTIIYMIH